MLQESLQHYYNRPQSFATKFHQVPVKLASEGSTEQKKCEEDWHLNGKAPSAIDTFSALNVCFNDISWIIRKIDKRSFIYGPNKKWLESTKMSKTGNELYGIAQSYKDRVN